MSAQEFFDSEKRRIHEVFDIASERDFITWSTPGLDRVHPGKVSVVATQTDTDESEKVIVVDGPNGGEYKIEQRYDDKGEPNHRVLNENTGDTASLISIRFPPRLEDVVAAWGEDDDEVQRWEDHRWDEVVAELEATGAESDADADFDRDPLGDETLPGETDFRPSARVDVDPGGSTGEITLRDEPDGGEIETEEYAVEEGDGEFPSNADSDATEDADEYVQSLLGDDSVTYSELLSDMHVPSDREGTKSFHNQSETPHTFVDELLAFGHNVPRAVNEWRLVDYGIVWPNNPGTRHLVWENQETLEIVALAATESDGIMQWNVYYNESPDDDEQIEPILVTDDPNEAINQITHHLYDGKRNVDVEIIEKQDGEIEIADRVDRQTLGNRIMERLGLDRNVSIPYASKLHDAKDSSIKFIRENTDRIADLAVLATIATVNRYGGYSKKVMMALNRVFDNHQLELRGSPIVEVDDEAIIPLTNSAGEKVTLDMVNIPESDINKDDGEVVLDGDTIVLKAESSGGDEPDEIELEGDLEIVGDDMEVKEKITTEGDLAHPEKIGFTIDGSYTYQGGPVDGFDIDAEPGPSTFTMDVSKFDLAKNNYFRAGATALSERNFGGFTLPIRNSEFSLEGVEESGNISTSSGSSGGDVSGVDIDGDTLRQLMGADDDGDDGGDGGDESSAAATLNNAPGGDVSEITARAVHEAFGEPALTVDEFDDQLYELSNEYDDAGKKMSEFVDTYVAIYATAHFVRMIREGKIDKDDVMDASPNNNKLTGFIGERLSSSEEFGEFVDEWSADFPGGRYTPDKKEILRDVKNNITFALDKADALEEAKDEIEERVEEDGGEGDGPRFDTLDRVKLQAIVSDVAEETEHTVDESKIANALIDEGTVSAAKDAHDKYGWSHGQMAVMNHLMKALDKTNNEVQADAFAEMFDPVETEGD